MNKNETWTTLKVLDWTKDFLASRGVDNARLEAEWLLCAATGLDRVGLYLNFEKPLNNEELGRYRDMVARRGRREPLQHILGTQEFCGLEFEVTTDVLIPRHDTETLVQKALEMVPHAHNVLDIGTGSGCIAVSMGTLLPDARVTAIDISPAALLVAGRNAARHGVEVELLQGSLFEPVAGRVFDLIVSNPPYIPRQEIETLQAEVKDYDPRLALDGGLDGLDFYRTLIPSAPEYLVSGGLLIVEIGAGQDSDVAAMFRACGEYRSVSMSEDGSGITRVVWGQKI